MTPEFTNSVILPENLPEINPADFQPVDRKYLKVLFINHAATGVIAGLMIAGIYLLSFGGLPGAFVWISGGGLLLLLGYSGLVTYISFPKRGYLIREKDIAYQRGMIRYRLTSIPFNRIQHVELIQSVLAKRMKLAKIKVYTAGSGADDLVIPGLPVDIALQIREFLTGKISPDEQD